MSPQLGIIFHKIEPKAIFSIFRFKVIARESFDLLEPHIRKRNLNFQINGEGDFEKIVVRIYLDEKSLVYKSRYYYLQGMDSEIANYLAQELMIRLKAKYVFRADHILKEIITWK